MYLKLLFKLLLNWPKKDISRKLLTCTDIKSGDLILNETPQMQFFGETIIGAIEKGQIAEWINSVLTSFNVHWGRNLDSNNTTQTHSIFAKIQKNTFLGLPKVKAWSIFTFSMPYVKT